MTHELACPACGRSLEVPELPAGARIRCPACSHVFEREPAARLATTGSATTGNATTRGTAPGVSTGTKGPTSYRAPTLALGPSPTTPPSIQAASEPTNRTSAAPQGPATTAPRWQLRTPEGLVFGPVDRPQLDQWVREGRVTADCQVREESSTFWQAADAVYPILTERTPTDAASPLNSPRTATAGPVAMMSAAPPGLVASGQAGQALLRPHRGPLILTLSIVGLLVQCPIFSVLAWVMGSSDLEEIYVGRMDPEGLKATRAGRMLGMIMSLFWIIMAVVAVSVFVLVVAVR